MKLYIMGHGIPGSGKSTIFEILSEYLDVVGCSYVRINRDDLRTVIAGEEYHNSKPDSAVEKLVDARVNELKADAFNSGSVILDDNTNLNARGVNRVRSSLAAGYTLVHVPVNVPLEVAHSRNKSRGLMGGRRVPGFVLEKMADNGYDDSRTAVAMDKFAVAGEPIIHANADGMIPGPDFDAFMRLLQG